MLNILYQSEISKREHIWASSCFWILNYSPKSPKIGPDRPSKTGTRFPGWKVRYTIRENGHSIRETGQFIRETRYFIKETRYSIRETGWKPGTPFLTRMEVLKNPATQIRKRGSHFGKLFGIPGSQFSGRPGTHFRRPAMTDFSDFRRLWAGVQKSKSMEYVL